MHLWEADHPYYMHEGSYCQAGQYSEYESFDDFITEWGDMDIDMNRVHRWDWREGGDWGVESDGSPDVMGELCIYYIMQRKARTYSCSVKVRRSDEPKVIEFLSAHAAREASIWHPIPLPAPTTAGKEQTHD